MAQAIDAWHRPEGIPQVGYGSLDVPLSVWVEPVPGALVSGLVRDLSSVNAAVALCGIPDVQRTDVVDRKVTVFGDRQVTADAQRAADDSASVRFVTAENLANHLAAAAGTFELLVAGLHASRGEGFWTAARRALVPGGYLAVITRSGNPATHARLARRVTRAGFVSMHHIVAVAPATLTKAVAAESAATTSSGQLRHVRAHRDAYVYRLPEVTR